jgi:hypothetical protein
MVKSRGKSAKDHAMTAVWGYTHPGGLNSEGTKRHLVGGRTGGALRPSGERKTTSRKASRY